MDKPKEVQQLEDELKMANIEWAQAFKDMQKKLEKLEKRICVLEELHSYDIKDICYVMLNGIIEKVSYGNINGNDICTKENFHHNEVKKRRIE